MTKTKLLAKQNHYCLTHLIGQFVPSDASYVHKLTVAAHKVFKEDLKIKYVCNCTVKQQSIRMCLFNNSNLAKGC